MISFLSHSCHALLSHSCRRYCPVPESDGFSVGSRCSLHVYVNLFMGVFAVSPYITLYLGQQLEVCFCLRFPVWCALCPRTTQCLCSFGDWFYRSGEEMCECVMPACRADTIITCTFSSLSNTNLSIPSISSHHIFPLEYFLRARPAFDVPRLHGCLLQ